MSSDEQVNATGRLIIEATESKKRLALLKYNAEALSRTLEAASHHVNGELAGVGHAEFQVAIQQIPAPDVVLKACADYKAELKSFQELKARVATLGLQL